MESPFSWVAPEYVFRKKSTDWFWAVGILAVAGAAISGLQGNMLFATFILLAGVSLIGFGHRRPRIVTFLIDEPGIRVGNIIYPWTRIKSFSLFAQSTGEETNSGTLVLYFERAFTGELEIPVPLSIAQELRQALARHSIEEEVQPRRFIDTVTRLLGF